MSPHSPTRSGDSVTQMSSRLCSLRSASNRRLKAWKSARQPFLRALEVSKLVLASARLSLWAWDLYWQRGGFDSFHFRGQNCRCEDETRLFCSDYSVFTSTWSRLRYSIRI